MHTPPGVTTPTQQLQLGQRHTHLTTFIQEDRGANIPLGISRILGSRSPRAVLLNQRPISLEISLIEAVWRADGVIAWTSVTNGLLFLIVAWLQ